MFFLSILSNGNWASASTQHNTTTETLEIGIYRNEYEEQQPPDTTTGRKQIIAKHWHGIGFPAHVLVLVSAYINGLQTQHNTKERAHRIVYTSAKRVRHTIRMEWCLLWWICLCIYSVRKIHLHTYTNVCSVCDDLRSRAKLYRYSGIFILACGNVATLPVPAAVANRSWCGKMGMHFLSFRDFMAITVVPRADYQRNNKPWLIRHFLSVMLNTFLSISFHPSFSLSIVNENVENTAGAANTNTLTMLTKYKK